MLVREFDLTDDSLEEIRGEIRKLIAHEEEGKIIPEVEPKTDLLWH